MAGDPELRTSLVQRMEASRAQSATSQPRSLHPSSGGAMMSDLTQVDAAGRRRSLPYGLTLLLPCVQLRRELEQATMETNRSPALISPLTPALGRLGDNTSHTYGLTGTPRPSTRATVDEPAAVCLHSLPHPQSHVQGPCR
jgi:hypothetical protein